MLSFIRLGLIVAALLLLQACVSAATTGAQAVYNRHSLQNNVNDQLTTVRINQALNFKTNDFRDANIDVATYNKEVLLVGQVPQAWQKEKAEQIAKSVPDVGKVYNLLSVAPPSSGLIRASDAWITSKIKARFIASNDLDATQIKVVTENGTVYLMGVLKPEEADAAVELARTTDGVQSVVKMFSYIHISKRENETAPAPQEEPQAKTFPASV